MIITKRELFNLLINPLDHDFSLRWHRDDIHENATEEEERDALRAWSYGVCQSHFLSVIPLTCFDILGAVEHARPDELSYCPSVTHFIVHCILIAVSTLFHILIRLCGPRNNGASQKLWILPKTL